MLTLMKPEIEEYALSKTEDDGDLLVELTKETYTSMDLPQMLTGKLEGRFLKFMVQSIAAKRILEIGMFTGYSALSMAEGLPDDGVLFTCDIDPKAIAMARRYFERSPHGKKVTIKEGPALKSIAELDGPFDLVFIDADKENYKNYYEAVLPLVRTGGLILVDNVLWSGAVLNPQTETDKAICDFNNHVAKDERVDRVMLTIRDGVYMIRKR